MTILSFIPFFVILFAIHLIVSLTRHGIITGLQHENKVGFFHFLNGNPIFNTEKDQMHHWIFISGFSSIRIILIHSVISLSFLALSFIYGSTDVASVFPVISVMAIVILKNIPSISTKRHDSDLIITDGLQLLPDTEVA